MVAMKKKGLYRKLIMSASAAAMTALCLTATTYAWFSRNENVWVEAAKMQMKWDDGILVSTDGTNFSQDISSKQFKELIAGTEDKFNSLKFEGSTINFDDEGNVVYDQDGYVEFIYDDVKGEDVYKDVIIDEDETTSIETSVLSGTEYHHEKSKANKNAEDNPRYIQFDLWFRLSAEGSTSSPDFREKYQLVFTDETSISTLATNVTLKNKLTALVNGEPKEFNSGDDIKVDLSNAMRLGCNSTDLGGITVFEKTNELDLGSDAIEGATDLIHNPLNNAMYTYYNSLFPNYPFEKAKEHSLESKNEYTGTSLGEFIYDYDKEEYNDVKVTFYMWMEGWDADYIYGVGKEGRDMDVYLEFTYVDSL